MISKYIMASFLPQCYSLWVFMEWKTLWPALSLLSKKLVRVKQGTNETMSQNTIRPLALDNSRSFDLPAEHFHNNHTDDFHQLPPSISFFLSSAWLSISPSTRYGCSYQCLIPLGRRRVNSNGSSINFQLTFCWLTLMGKSSSHIIRFTLVQLYIKIKNPFQGEKIYFVWRQQFSVSLIDKVLLGKIFILHVLFESNALAASIYQLWSISSFQIFSFLIVFHTAVVLNNTESATPEDSHLECLLKRSWLLH